MNVKKLSNLIEERKIPKAEIIRRAGISKPTLDSILEGKDFKVSNLEKIAQALNIPVGYLFDDTELPTSVNISSNGKYSAAANQGDASIVVGDSILIERIKSLEAILSGKDEMIAEKDDRIKELKECMEILKTR